MLLWRQRCCLLSRRFVIVWSVSTAIRLILWRWRRLLPAVLGWWRWLLLIRSTLDLMMRRWRWSVMILVLLTRMRLLLRRWLLLLH